MAKTKSGGEIVWHVAGVRLRVVGEGNLNMYLKTLDEARSYTILPLAMSAAPGIEPTRLGNIRSQRVQLEFSVAEEDEWFNISKIVIFAKPSAMSLPL